MVETEKRTNSHYTKEQNLAAYGGEFESYLISALNDSLIKKSKYQLIELAIRVLNVNCIQYRLN